MTIYARPPEPLIIGDAETVLPPGRTYWLEDSMFDLDKFGLPVPRFSVQDAAKFFFARSPDWMRQRMRSNEKLDERTGVATGDHPHGFFLLDGEPIVFKRTKAGARYFTLADIERMGYALSQERVIDGRTLNLVILLVKICAKQYEVDLAEASDR